MTCYVTAILTIILCVLRVHGEKSIFFQAVAHLYVAWLFAGAYYAKKKCFLYLAIGLSAVETFCFLYGLKG
jgi:hypothetical protein